MNESSFFSTQVATTRNQISTLEKLLYEPEAPDAETSILVIGSRRSGKSALVNTFCRAYHNNIYQTGSEGQQQIRLTKTYLKKAKKYQVSSPVFSTMSSSTNSNSSSDSRTSLNTSRTSIHEEPRHPYITSYSNGRSIAFYQYSEKLDVKLLVRFAEMLGIGQNIYNINCMTSTARLPAQHIKGLVVCLKLGEVLAPAQHNCLQLMINELEDRGVKPTIILTHLDQFAAKITSQFQSAQAIQREMQRVARDFAISRDRVFTMQNYSSSAKQSSEEINYFALQLLAGILREVKNTTNLQNKSRQKIQTGFLGGSKGFVFCGC